MVERHFQALYRFFRPRLGSEAPDLIQKTLLAAVEARDRVPEGVSFRAYLLGIARKQLLMHFRRQTRGDRAVEAIGHAPPESRASPSGAVAMREEQRLLLRGLRTLPLDQQMTLELFYWEGLSRVEIATVLGVQPATVKSRLERAKQRLRETVLELEPVTGQTTVRELDRWARSLKELVEDGPEHEPTGQ